MKILIVAIKELPYQRDLNHIPAYGILIANLPGSKIILKYNWE